MKLDFFSEVHKICQILQQFLWLLRVDEMFKMKVRKLLDQVGKSFEHFENSEGFGKRLK